MGIVDISKYRQENPTLTLAEIGKKFGVSRQYIHKVLKQTNTPTKRAKKQTVKYCLICGKNGSRSVCTGKCHFQYYNIKVNCASCRISFYRKRGQIVSKYNRGYNKIYCSRRCYYRGKRNQIDRLKGSVYNRTNEF